MPGDIGDRVPKRDIIKTFLLIPPISDNPQTSDSLIYSPPASV